MKNRVTTNTTITRVSNKIKANNRVMVNTAGKGKVSKAVKNRK